MTPEQLEAVREKIGATQDAMADLLQCDYVGYKRYATGARPVPRYVERSALALLFIHKSGLLEAFQRFLKSRVKT